MQHYDHLRTLSREIRVLKGVHSLLDWDQETYMPSAGTEIRAEQFKVLAGIIHKAKTGATYTKALGKLIDIKSGKVIDNGLSSAQKAALREWHRDYRDAKALPKSFVQKWAEITSKAMHVWRKAREENRFDAFAPYLKQIVEMSRKKAEYLGYKKHPYDALLDHYEPDTSVAELTPLFSELRNAITTLLKTLAKKKSNDQFLYGEFPQDKQIDFGHLILKTIDYDMNKGRLDLSAHPFSSASHPTDSRITTRVHSSALMSNISAVLHEAGHGLYEMGLPIEAYGTPLGDAVSLGVHESQSRWWETRIGLSKGFWSYFFPLLQRHFKGKFDDITLQQFYEGINKVTPSYIRVEADEVTYGLHVILRYELEKELIEGSLRVQELPDAWNAKMQELLGITPPSLAEGCLQDIHWSMGAIGYFPSYTLGNLYCAHFFKAFEGKYPDWEKRIAKGEFNFMKEWLRENIHQHGRRYIAKELLKKVTGTPFSSQAYIEYLNGKYLKGK